MFVKCRCRMCKSEVILFVFSIFLLNLSQICDGSLPGGIHLEEKEENALLCRMEDGEKRPEKLKNYWGMKKKSEESMPLTDEIIRDAGYLPQSYYVDVRVGKDIKIEPGGRFKGWRRGGRTKNTEDEDDEYWNTFKTRIFRIRHPKKLKETNLPVILLMHGCTGSSSDYVFGGKKDGLGFYLADHGFDVWLGNLRGNFYAGLHINTSAFWDFSFHEMGLYDLPDQIDFILSKTGQKQIFYLGYSMGSTSVYVMLSQLPEYNKKIVRMITVAPVVFMDWRMANWLQKILVLAHAICDATSKATNIRFISYWLGPMKWFKTPKCFRGIWKTRCKLTINMMASTDKSVFNKELRKKFYKIMPVGTSIKTLMHYLKLTGSRKFQPYPYNSEKNFDVYGVYEVPSYPLEKITVPTLLLLAKKDGYVPEPMIDNLKQSLKGIEEGQVVKKWVDNEYFKHLDFFLGQNLEKLFFEPVHKYLKGLPIDENENTDSKVDNRKLDL